jgi:signal peptidase
MLRKRKFPIRGVITGLLVSLAVGVAVIGLVATVGHDGRTKLLVVQTGSMEPTIPIGSLVVTRPASSYAVGDVVTYRLGKNYVTHRVVEIVNGAYRTKGDANNSPDGNLVLPSTIVGKLFVSLPHVGRFINFVKTPLGFSLLIVVPALWVVLQEIRTIGHELAKMELAKLRGSRTLKAKRSKPKRPTPLQRRRKIGGGKQWQQTVQAAVVLLLTLGSLLGGTKAYFSNVGLSSNNVVAAKQFIATTLVINELIYSSSCTPNPGDKIAIELWNGSAVTVNLKDWSLRDQLGNTVQISNSNTNLPSGQFALMSKSNSTFVSGCYGTEPSGVITVNLGGSIVINSTSGFLELLDSTSTVIDGVAYGSPNPVAAADKSIERKQLGFDTATGNGFNASDFISQFPATLGFALPTPQTVVINEFMVQPDSGSPQEFIELRNNSAVGVTISGWQIFSGNGTTLRATVPASTTLAAGARYLQQYAGGGNELPNTDDKIFLKDTGGAIRDAFSYFKFAPTSGTSWSRIPEGTSTWVLDSTETPGAANVL